MWLVTWIASVIIARGETLDFRLEHIPESGALYYEHMGEGRLSSNVCKIPRYVDLALADEKFETVRKYAMFTLVV
jgi:hypothetical protein